MVRPSWRSSKQNALNLQRFPHERADPLPSQRLHPSSAGLLILAVVLIQFVLVSITFPLSQLLSGEPLFHIDSPFHWYKMEAARGFARLWHLSGYDPYFGAGYLGGVNMNAAVKLPAALSVLLSPWLDSIVVYKLYVFLVAVLGPSCVPIAMRLLRLSTPATVAATVSGLLIWWLSANRWYHTAGMNSFVFCSYLALPYAALVIRYLTEPTTWLVPLSLAVVGALGLFIHPEFPIPVAFMVAALTLALWRDVQVRKLPMAFVAIPLLCALPNLFWALPTFLNASFKVFLQGQPYQKAVDINIVWQEALGRYGPHARGANINPVLWLGALWACTAPMEQRARRIAGALVAAAIALILFAALGAALPSIATMQPNRFSSTAYLVLCIPAGIGLASIAGNVRSKGFWRMPAMGAAAAFIGAIAYLGWELVREISPADIPRYGARPPEVRGIGSDSQWILAWLREHTDKSARVLFQVSKARVHDGAHMAGYLALASDREFAGGPYPHMFFSGFYEDTLFGRPINMLTGRQVTDYFNLYNVGWTIVFSEPAKRLFDTLPELVAGDSHGPFKVYTVRGQRSFFLEGTGRVVDRTFGRIELDSLSGGSVTLKYHYVPGLRTEPSRRVEWVMRLEDPTPFIRIVDPPSHLMLKLP